MKQLRIRATVVIIWLTIFYIATHFLEWPNINPLTFLFALFLVIFSLAIPNLSKIIKLWFYLLPIFLFWCIKAISGLAWNNDVIFITIVESITILITVVLLLWLRGSIQEFNNSVALLSVGIDNMTHTESNNDQSILYREVKRARNHNRPLSIMTISVTNNKINYSSDRIIEEAQQRLSKQLTLGYISRILRKKLEDCDVVAQTNNHFLVILPETSPEDLPGLKARLRSQIKNQVGVDVCIGSASLPKDSFTMEGLIEVAALEMQGSPKLDFINESERELIENKTV